MIVAKSAQTAYEREARGVFGVEAPVMVFGRCVIPGEYAQAQSHSSLWPNHDPRALTGAGQADLGRKSVMPPQAFEQAFFPALVLAVEFEMRVAKRSLNKVFHRRFVFFSRTGYRENAPRYSYYEILTEHKRGR